jgi:hypothetical protein
MGRFIMAPPFLSISLSQYIVYPLSNAVLNDSAMIVEKWKAGKLIITKTNLQ